MIQLVITIFVLIIFIYNVFKCLHGKPEINLIMFIEKKTMRLNLENVDQFSSKLNGAYLINVMYKTTRLHNYTHTVLPAVDFGIWTFCIPREVDADLKYQ